MTEILSLTERYGAWLVIAAYLIYRVIPSVIEKGWPQWVAVRRDAERIRAEAEARDLEALTKVYERFIDLMERTLKYIATSTETINSNSRSVDANTQQVYRLGQAILTGAKCPLPDCPFMNRATGSVTIPKELPRDDQG